MPSLSVNLNKVALLRNARDNGIPSVLHAAEQCIAAGAQGITVHPRPDQRHIRISDVHDLAGLLERHPRVEFNIEGNPFPEFMQLVGEVRPHQVTLVPDAPGASTSDHGWDLDREGARLRPLVAELRQGRARVSLFMDADSTQWEAARALGADRIELYTEPWAVAFARNDVEPAFAMFTRAARAAQAAGLGVNAGHDLNLRNLPRFCTIGGILEVSIGHALVADALDMGWAATVRAYLAAMR